jgi:alpha-beta hydrolase superfamily lysophospholipase
MTLSWQAPEGLRTRGTVIVLPGRGEHGGVYERFGRRLAADGYAVHALDVSAHDDTAAVRETVAAITAHATAPVVLAGSDTGALRALALVSESELAVDGLIVAALPHPQARAGSDDWDWELGARTTCPVHRARLSEDTAFVRGSLSEPIPPALATALAGPGLELVKTPVLVLHGGSDPIAPVGYARELAARLPRAELAVVESTPHDVLNDSTHRTVAAQVVQWLERLRNGPELTPVITVTTAELAAIP